MCCRVGDGGGGVVDVKVPELDWRAVDFDGDGSFVPVPRVCASYLFLAARLHDEREFQAGEVVEVAGGLNHARCHRIGGVIGASDTEQQADNRQV